MIRLIKQNSNKDLVDVFDLRPTDHNGNRNLDRRAKYSI